MKTQKEILKWLQAKGYEFIPKKTVPPGESWLKP